MWVETFNILCTYFTFLGYPLQHQWHVFHHAWLAVRSLCMVCVQQNQWLCKVSTQYWGMYHIILCYCGKLLSFDIEEVATVDNEVSCGFLSTGRHVMAQFVQVLRDKFLSERIMLNLLQATYGLLECTQTTCSSWLSSQLADSGTLALFHTQLFSHHYLLSAAQHYTWHRGHNYISFNTVFVDPSPTCTLQPLTSQYTPKYALHSSVLISCSTSGGIFG